jgi:ribosomal protein S18 acetylase RimI-like enzyme
MKIDFEEPSGDGAKAVWQGLVESNRRIAGRPEPQAFSWVVRNDAGEVIGGLNAIVHWDKLVVDHLWLDESLRGKGLGRELMLKAHAEGLKRGATKALLDTNDWQAPGFYEKLGYMVFGSHSYNGGRYMTFFMIKEPLA